MTDINLRIIRQRCGRGFTYLYDSGRRVANKRILKRIQNLVIPPNWQQVVIAEDAVASLQATGIDAKGRKQYLYHPKWHQARQQEKFAKLVDFACLLPEFRALCWSLVDHPGWSREKSLALVCLMLDHTGMRAGNKQYTSENKTFGLTTLRRQHLEREGKNVALSFTGKHGKSRHVNITNTQLADLVCDSAQAQGYAIFRYQTPEGHWQDVDSGDVNQFIHERAGQDFTCKDFRTWGASRYGLTALEDVEAEIRDKRRRRWDTTFVRYVAQMLGNTPNVCRQYYLHPKLFSTFEATNERQEFIDELRKELSGKRNDDERITTVEHRLVEIISS